MYVSMIYTYSWTHYCIQSWYKKENMTYLASTTRTLWLLLKSKTLSGKDLNQRYLQSQRYQAYAAFESTAAVTPWKSVWLGCGKVGRLVVLGGWVIVFFFCWMVYVNPYVLDKTTKLTVIKQPMTALYGIL